MASLFEKLKNFKFKKFQIYMVSRMKHFSSTLTTRVCPPGLPFDTPYLVMANPIAYAVARKEPPYATDLKLVIHGPRHFYSPPPAPLLFQSNSQFQSNSVFQPYRSPSDLYFQNGPIKYLPGFLLKSGMDLATLLKVWPNLKAPPVGVDPMDPLHHAIVWVEQYDKHADGELILDYLLWGMSLYHTFSVGKLPTLLPAPTATKGSYPFVSAKDLFLWGQNGLAIALFKEKGKINAEIQITEIYLPVDDKGNMLDGAYHFIGFVVSPKSLIRLF